MISKDLQHVRDYEKSESASVSKEERSVFHFSPRIGWLNDPNGFSYYKGECTLEESVELIKKKSRNYAKRQYTWFNNQMNLKWFNVNYKNFDKTCVEVYDYILKKVV